MDTLSRKISTDQIAALKGTLQALAPALTLAEADKSLVAQIESFADLLEREQEDRPSVISTTIRHILLGVDVVLRNRLFMFIPPADAPYYMNLEQFGKAVGMFPEAVGDMLEASTCYASGHSTACVFHSMRVAEFGLRHIARELGVVIKERKKPCPIEFGTWEKVLVEIENKRDALRQEPKSKEHNEKTVKYATMAHTCSYLKDIFRNDTMHSRKMYSTEEALAAMTRVVEFMNALAGSEYAPPIEPKLAEATGKLTEWSKTLTVQND